MNPLKILFLLIAIVFTFIPESTLAISKHALLIGIQDYQSTSFSSLKGPVNDIKLTEGVLRERFGFQDKDFLILLDEKATHTGIEKAFNALIERVKKDDFVYIHYSGHGSQTKDLNGDERSGQDQTWVTFGARANKESKATDNFDILDDEINAWLARLYAKTSQVIFVSDSCHSATASRGISRGKILSRAVDNDQRLHPLGKLIYARPTVYHGIRIGAARDRESAIETFQEDGKFYGLFSWYWTQALQQAQAGETWQDVFKRAYTRVATTRGMVQKPQMEGKSRQQVLSGVFTPQSLTIPVTEVTDNEVKIQAGRLTGVTRGSVYRLYSPKEANKTNGVSEMTMESLKSQDAVSEITTESLKRPTLTITRVKAFESFGITDSTFQVGNLVVEESHAYSFAPIKVYLEADFPAQDHALLQTIRTAFQPFPDGRHPLRAYALTDDPINSDLRLYLLHPKRENGQLIYHKNEALPQSFPEQPPELWVVTPEQRLLHKNLQMQFSNPTRGVELLQNNLQKFARLRELKTLQTSRRRTKAPVTIETYLLSLIDLCATDEACVFLPDDLGYFHKQGPYSLQATETLTIGQGDILTFTLHNHSRRDYYCYLIDLAPDGAVYAIFPDPEQRAEYALVKAGETRDLIEDVGLMAESVGEETIKLITSRHPIDISLLEQGGFERRGGTKGDFNPLEQLLVNAVHGQRGRISLRNNEWSTAQATFEVK